MHYEKSKKIGFFFKMQQNKNLRELKSEIMEKNERRLKYVLSSYK